MEKKIYEKPTMEIVKLEQQGMLCISGDLSGDANEPAKARMFDGGWDDLYDLNVE